MKRKEILEQAEGLIYGERSSEYGHPVLNHTDIGIIWGVILQLGEPVPPVTVAAMMAGVKLARIAKTPDHDDSWVDLAGYAAIGGECAGVHRKEMDSISYDETRNTRWNDERNVGPWSDPKYKNR